MANKKKIDAGKKRASLSLRDNKGRFTSNAFKREVLKTVAAKKGFDVSEDTKQKDRDRVDELLKEARITQKELNNEYKKNIDFFSDLIHSGYSKTTLRNSDQLLKDIEAYKGRFIIERNGQEIEVSKTEMKLEVKKLKQALSSGANIQEIALRGKLTFDGKMKINVPELKQIREKLKEYKDGGELFGDMAEDVASLFDNEEDVIIYGS